MQRKRKPYKPPTCSACGQEGHRKNSPKCRLHGQNLMPSTNDTSPPPVGATHQATTNSLGSVKHIFVVFDLETTGFSRLLDDIVEISAQALDQNGENFAAPPFSRLAKPQNGVGYS